MNIENKSREKFEYVEVPNSDFQTKKHFISTNECSYHVNINGFPAYSHSENGEIFKYRLGSDQKQKQMEFDSDFKNFIFFGLFLLAVILILTRTYDLDYKDFFIVSVIFLIYFSYIKYETRMQDFFVHKENTSDLSKLEKINIELEGIKYYSETGAYVELVSVLLFIFCAISQV